MKEVTCSLCCYKDYCIGDYVCPEFAPSSEYVDDTYIHNLIENGRSEFRTDFFNYLDRFYD